LVFIFTNKGVREIDLHGVELDEERAAHVCAHLPVDDLRRDSAMTFGLGARHVRAGESLDDVHVDPRRRRPSAHRVGIDSVSGARRIGVLVAQS
jgi:hypothetical protein